MCLCWYVGSCGCTQLFWLYGMGFFITCSDGSSSSPKKASDIKDLSRQIKMQAKRLTQSHHKRQVVSTDQWQQDYVQIWCRDEGLASKCCNVLSMGALHQILLLPRTSGCVGALHVCITSLGFRR